MPSLAQAALAAVLALSGAGASCRPEPITLPTPPVETMGTWVNPFAPSMLGLSSTVVRRVDPATLSTPDGWNVATAAQLQGQAPLWQRGDSAVPVGTSVGTLLTYADTWARNGKGERYLVRNTALLVRPDGTVVWYSHGNQPGGVAVPAPAGQWWWPGGGIPTGTGAVLFGSLWTTGAGYGTSLGPAVSAFIDREPRALPVDLPRAYRWGTPYRAGNQVILPGYDPATWKHYLATHPSSDRSEDYVTGWTVQPLTVEQQPLEPLSIRPHAGGWLATAKILSSAPELNYEETPEIFAWTATAGPAGPYKRVGVVVPDTRRPGTRSYQGSLQELPGAGLVASWSRNVMPGNTGGPDEYGTIFAPGWWPLRVV